MKISKEVAEVEFARFADLMRLETDPAELGEEKASAFEEQKSVLLRAIMRGELAINDDGEPVYTIQRGKDADKQLTFAEPTGAALMGLGAGGDQTKQLYAAMAEITGTSSAVFSQMKMSDLKICTAIITLFFG